MTIGSGKRRHLITIQRQVTTSFDGMGKEIPVIDDIAKVWASIEPLRGTEAILARQLDGNMSHRITIDWSTDVSGVTRKDFIEFGDRTFYLSDVRNIEESNREIEMLAGETV